MDGYKVVMNVEGLQVELYYIKQNIDIKKKYKFIMHLCPRCKRQLEKNSQQNNKLINRCNIFIDSFLNSC